MVENAVARTTLEKCFSSKVLYWIEESLVPWFDPRMYAKYLRYDEDPFHKERRKYLPVYKHNTDLILKQALTKEDSFSTNALVYLHESKDIDNRLRTIVVDQRLVRRVSDFDVDGGRLQVNLSEQLVTQHAQSLGGRGADVMFDLLRWNHIVGIERIQQLMFTSETRVTMSHFFGLAAMVEECLNRPAMRNPVHSTCQLVGEYIVGMRNPKDPGEMVVILNERKDMSIVNAIVQKLVDQLQVTLFDRFEKAKVPTDERFVVEMVDRSSEYRAEVVVFDAKVAQRLTLYFTYARLLTLELKDEACEGLEVDQMAICGIAHLMKLTREMFILEEFGPYPDLRLGLCLVMDLWRQQSTAAEILRAVFTPWYFRKLAEGALEITGKTILPLVISGRSFICGAAAAAQRQRCVQETPVMRPSSRFQEFQQLDTTSILSLAADLLVIIWNMSNEQSFEDPCMVVQRFVAMVAVSFCPSTNPVHFLGLYDILGLPSGRVTSVRRIFNAAGVDLLQLDPLRQFGRSSVKSFQEAQDEPFPMDLVNKLSCAAATWLQQIICVRNFHGILHVDNPEDLARLEFLMEETKNGQRGTCADHVPVSQSFQAPQLNSVTHPGLLPRPTAPVFTRHLGPPSSPRMQVPPPPPPPPRQPPPGPPQPPVFPPYYSHAEPITPNDPRVARHMLPGSVAAYAAPLNGESSWRGDLSMPRYVEHQPSTPENPPQSREWELAAIAAFPNLRPLPITPRSPSSSPRDLSDPPLRAALPRRSSPPPPFPPRRFREDKPFQLSTSSYKQADNRTTPRNKCDLVNRNVRRASSHDRENIGPRRDQRVFSRPKTSYSRRDAGNRISKAKMTKGSGRFSPDSPRSSPRSSDSFRMSSSSRRHINSKKYRRQ